MFVARTASHLASAVGERNVEEALKESIDEIVATSGETALRPFLEEVEDLLRKKGLPELADDVGVFTIDYLHQRRARSRRKTRLSMPQA